MYIHLKIKGQCINEVYNFFVNMCFYHAILFALKNEIIISLTHNFATAIVYKLRKKRGNRK